MENPVLGFEVEGPGTILEEQARACSGKALAYCTRRLHKAVASFGLLGLKGACRALPPICSAGIRQSPIAAEAAFISLQVCGGGDPQVSARAARLAQ